MKSFVYVLTVVLAFAAGAVSLAGYQKHARYQQYKTAREQGHYMQLNAKTGKLTRFAATKPVKSNCKPCDDEKKAKKPPVVPK